MHLRVPAHCMEAEWMQRRGSYVRVSCVAKRKDGHVLEDWECSLGSELRPMLTCLLTYLLNFPFHHT